MILEYVEGHLRAEALERAAKPNNPLRASAMGRCIREGCFDLLGLPGKPLQPRRMLTLKQGSSIHDDLLTPLIKKAMGDKFLTPDELKLPEHVEIDGVKIAFHIDGAFKWADEV